MMMKIFYAFLSILFFTIMPVFAQDQPLSGTQQPPSVDDIVAKMKIKASLTQDQVTAVTPIIEKYIFKSDQLRQSMREGTADKDRIRQMKQLRADEKQELSQVLSAEQLNQWEQMQSQERHKHADGGNGGGSSEPGD